MAYEFEILEIEPVPTLAIRRTAPPERLGEAMTEIFAQLRMFMRRHGIEPAGPCYARYLAHTESGFDFESGWPLKERVQGEGEISAGDLPGGRAVVYTHTGPYRKLGEAHDAGCAWAKEQGLEEAAGPWEYYLNDPAETPEDRLQTRIFRPIAKS